MRQIYLLCAYLSFISISGTFGQASQNMNLLATWAPNEIEDYSDCWGYVDCDGNEYAIIGSRNAVHFIDISDPDNPDEVAGIEGGDEAFWRDIKTYGKWAYSVCDACSEGLMIFDLGNLPNEVTLVTQTNAHFNRAHNIYIDEANGRLYAVGTNTRSNGVIVLDLAANPANPPQLASVQLQGGYVHDIFVQGNTAYCSSANNGLWVYDMANAQNPVLLGNLTSYPEQGYNHSSWLVPGGEFLVFTDETHDTGVKLTQVSDLTDITVIETFRSALLAPANTASIAHNPFVRDNFAIISYYHDGLQIFDISNPENIEQVAWYDTHPPNSNYNNFTGCWGAYPFLPSGIQLASDINFGLFILEPTAIVFDPVPAPSPPNANISVSGPTTLCEGETLELSVPGGATVYTWYQNGTTIVGSSNELTVFESGNYHVEICSGPCSAISNTIPVVVGVTPDVTLNVDEDESICQGESLIIEVPTGANNYQWFFNGLPTGGNSNTFVATESGQYFVSVSNSGCAFPSAMVSLEVTPLPGVDFNVDGPVDLCAGESLTLAVPPGATDYDWFVNNVLVSENDNSIEVIDPGNYQVVAYNGICSNSSEIVTIEAVEFPDVNIDADPQNILCEGESIVLTATIGAESYTWFQNGIPILTGSNTITIGAAGDYYLEAANGSCVSVSSSITVEVNSGPDLSWDFAAINQICEGEELSLTVPPGADNYDWYFNDELLAETGNILIASEAGSYFVLGNNSDCSASSDTIIIETIPYPEAPMNIEAEVIDLCAKESFLLEITTDAETFQWYQNGEVIGGNSSSITVSEAGTYFAEVSNGDCTTQSESVLINIIPLPDTTLTIGNSSTICEGESFPLSLPEGAENYQWFFNGEPLEEGIASIAAKLEGEYYAVVSNGNCSLTTQTVEVTVIPLPSLELNVELENSICSSDSLIISVPDGAESYQWYMNDQPLPETDSSITVFEAGNYYVVAANDFCENTSEIVELAVTLVPDVSILNDPENTICAGTSLLIGTVDGADAYQWYLDGEAITGANSFEINADASGTYTVLASIAGCNATSEETVLEIAALPVVEILNSSQLAICDGDEIELNATPGFEEYTWYQNDEAIGSNSSSLLISQAGIYFVEVSDGTCSNTTETVELTINPLPEASFVSTAEAICTGEVVTLVGPEGIANYQWWFNGEAIEGATNANFEASMAGIYLLSTATEEGCVNQSEPLELFVNSLPDAYFESQNEAICPGETTLLVGPVDIPNYQWWLNGEAIEGATNANFEASMAGVYILTTTSSADCMNSSEPFSLEVYETTIPTINLEENILTSSPASSYQWYFNGAAISTAINQSLEANDSGVYEVQTTDENGCVTVSEPLNFMLTTTYSPILDWEVRLFPNPTPGNIFYEIIRPDNAFDGEIQLYDQLGRQLSRIAIPGKKHVQQELKLTGLASGVYLLRFIDENGNSITKKIIKK